MVSTPCFPIGFHMIVQIVLIAPVVSKNFEMIETTGMIGSFNIILSIASKTRDVGSSAMSLGQTMEFLHMFCKQAKHNDGFSSDSQPSTLLFTFSLDFEFHEDIVSH